MSGEIGAYADDSYKGHTQRNVIIDVDFGEVTAEDIVLANAMVIKGEQIQSKSSMLRASYTSQLRLTQYFQTDSRWKNDLMKSQNLSIGYYGCALTSLTMIISFYGQTKTPNIITTAGQYIG